MLLSFKQPVYKKPEIQKMLVLTKKKVVLHKSTFVVAHSKIYNSILCSCYTKVLVDLQLPINIPVIPLLNILCCFFFFFFLPRYCYNLQFNSKKQLLKNSIYWQLKNSPTNVKNFLMLRYGCGHAEAFMIIF